MCRLLAYLGSPISLERLLYTPEHSLIVQSYQPQEMISGVVNADGFGIGWYHAQKDTEPFIYKHILPIWNDQNLPYLSRYVESGRILGYVRSATTGQALDFSNSQPFQYQRLLFTHNGRIENFRQTLYRPIRNQLSNEIYQSIKGSTDSEHIFALLLNQWQSHPAKSVEQALHITLFHLLELAAEYESDVSANIILSDGDRLIACRFSSKSPAPSLYWLENDSNFPESVIIASEPIFNGNWTTCPENSIISVGEDRVIQVEHI